MTEVAGTIAAVREKVRAARAAGHSIGCVPTMGALHEGHGALLDRARADAGFVVVSIFVNPVQFDRWEDYERYARNLEADVALCQSRGADLVFAPSASEMYPTKLETFIEVPEVARHLCGEFRPGHFRGVATVVAKLFLIVQPDSAYFGEKDAQQLAVIARMTHDLNFPVRIVPVETVREADGLALSSRNQRLNSEERGVAARIYQALLAGQSLIAEGERDAEAVRRQVMRSMPRDSFVKVEYVGVVDRSMQPVGSISEDVRLATAVWVGNTRLIDNVLCPV